MGFSIGHSVKGRSKQLHQISKMRTTATGNSTWQVMCHVITDLRRPLRITEQPNTARGAVRTGWLIKVQRGRSTNKDVRADDFGMAYLRCLTGIQRSGTVTAKGIMKL